MHGDDELDNLFRQHLASELDPMRGQARRAFEREVTRPMHRRLRLNAARRTIGYVAARARHVAPLALAMAACTALGFFLPRVWNTAGPGAPMATATPAGVATGEDGPATPPSGTPSSTFGSPHLADYQRTVLVHHEDQGPAVLPDGSPGRRVLQNRSESAHYTDPQTQAHTEYFMFPPDQYVVYPTGRQ